MTDAQIAELSLRLFYTSNKYGIDPYHKEWVQNIGIPFAREIEKIVADELAALPKEHV